MVEEGFGDLVDTVRPKEIRLSRAIGSAFDKAASCIALLSRNSYRTLNGLLLRFFAPNELSSSMARVIFARCFLQ